MIYLLMFAVSLFLVCSICRVSKFLQNVLFVLVVLLSAVLFGLRDKAIGTDTSGYVYDFFSGICKFSNWNEFISNSFRLDKLELLYTRWNYCVSLLTHDFNLFLFLTGVLMYGLFYYAFFKERKIISLNLAFFIFFFAFYNGSYNALRQYMAMAFCMVGFSMLMEEKYKWSVFFAIVACGFHQTAFLFFLVILIKKFSTDYFHILSYGKVRLLFISLLTGGLTSLSYVLSFFEKIGMDDRYRLRYGSSDRYGASFPYSIFALCMMNLIVLYSSKKKHNDATYCFFEYIMISSVILCFAGLISVFATRMNTYYLICSCIMVPYIFRNYVIPSNVRRGYILFLVMYWFLVVVVANLSDTFPYKSIILGL